MRLSAFILANLDQILVDWVAFARQQQPAAHAMDEKALLDHGKLILQEIAADIRRPQDDSEQQAKSEGHSVRASSSRNVPSRAHARQRERQGFEIEQMVAEYRALRATVMRLWSASTSFGSVDDIEDVIRFNEAVDQAIAESLTVFLAEVDRTRDLFLGMLGHDLRGPLSVIATCIALEQKSRPQESKTGGIVLRSVAHMEALLNDLVVYTRNRLGAGLPIAPAPLDLETLARHTVSEIETVSGGQALHLETQGDTQGEWDSQRLHQALSNLIFNALKYGDPKSVKVRLDGRSGDAVTLAVENSGKVIPAALLARIFDPLVRAEDEDTSPDSLVSGANLGLGLYVVREVATAHGGTAEVTSDANLTRFELRLPRFPVPRAN